MGGGHITHMGHKRRTYKNLVVRPAEKKPLSRRRRNWKDNIKTDLQEVGQVAGRCKCGNNFRVPLHAENFLTS
jgi:hypothetical protein